MSINSLSITPVPPGGGVVRMLMLVPQCHLLFIGPVACARHDVLSSMYVYRDRVSYLCLEELDIITGNWQDLLVQAVGQIMDTVVLRPEAMLLYSGCQDSLIGTDYASLLTIFQKQYGIPFRHFAMNRMPSPSRAPLVHILNKSLYDFLEIQDEHKDTINLLGTMVPLALDNELFTLLDKAGVQDILHVKKFQKFHEFQNMGSSRANLVLHPNALLAAEEMETRLNIPWKFVPVSYSIAEIRIQYQQIEELLGCSFDLSRYEEKLRYVIEDTKKIMGTTGLTVNGTGVCRPYDLARALTEYGFRVDELFAGPVPEYDQAAWVWVQKNVTDLVIRQPVTPAWTHFERALIVELSSLEGAYFGFAAVGHLMKVLQETFYIAQRSA